MYISEIFVLSNVYFCTHISTLMNQTQSAVRWHFEAELPRFKLWPNSISSRICKIPRDQPSRCMLLAYWTSRGNERKGARSRSPSGHRDGHPVTDTVLALTFLCYLFLSFLSSFFSFYSDSWTQCYTFILMFISFETGLSIYFWVFPRLVFFWDFGGCRIQCSAIPLSSNDLYMLQTKS